MPYLLRFAPQLCGWFPLRKSFLKKPPKREKLDSSWSASDLFETYALVPRDVAYATLERRKKSKSSPMSGCSRSRSLTGENGLMWILFLWRSGGWYSRLWGNWHERYLCADPNRFTRGYIFSRDERIQSSGFVDRSWASIETFTRTTASISGCVAENCR